MAFDVWPDTVPVRMILGTYTEKIERWVDSFNPEQGPPIEGISSTISTDIIGWDQLLTWTEFSLLKTFYRTTLNSGTKYFTLANPFSGTSETLMFVEPPEAHDLGAQQTASNNTDRRRITYRITIRLRRFN